MANETGNDWGKSAAAVVVSDGKVLLARHTYGPGKGLLIIPGGYLKQGESPVEAVRREVFEETGVMCKPVKLLGMRFNEKDWYAVFEAEYISGEARSDGDENDEVVWLTFAEAAEHPDVADLTKKLIARAAEPDGGLRYADYNGTKKYGDYSLYC